MLLAAVQSVPLVPSRMQLVLPVASARLELLLRRLAALHARRARKAQAPAGSPAQHHVLCVHLAQQHPSLGLHSVDCVLLALLRLKPAWLRAHHALPVALLHPQAFLRATSALSVLFLMLQAPRAYLAFPLAPASATPATL